MSSSMGSINRITKEIAHIHKGVDVSLAAACRDNDVRHVRALIVGPPETPYEFGFFEFTFKFPKDYPIKPPGVLCITTNGGQTRFNPNIYAQGKVCLSILGTWPGEKGEEWSSAQGLESTLLSIQSLMSSNPWENEPGHEGGKITEKDPAAYASKVRHETLRIAVIDRLERLLKITPSKVTSPEPPLDEDAIAEIMANSTKVDAVMHKMSPQSATTAATTSTTTSTTAAATTATPTVTTTATAKTILSEKLKSLKKKWTSGDYTQDGLDDEDLDDEDDSADTELSVHEYDAEATYNSLNPSPWDPFADLMKRRFLWYYDSYVLAIEKASSQQKDGKRFSLTRFEMPGNGMPGAYAYLNLLTRINRIRDALSNECTSWTQLGAKQVEAKTQLATQLAFQFDQLKYHYNETSYTGSRIEISLPDKKNPFAWHMTLFGQSSTNLDGGVFNISLTIPPDFPDTWPRVYVETPIFHHRVSASTGTLCYFPAKPDEMSSHLKAIVAAIEDLEPNYDPRSVINPEAAKLLWGNEADKKTYFRKLRRSAQDSMEF